MASKKKTNTGKPDANLVVIATSAVVFCALMLCVVTGQAAWIDNSAHALLVEGLRQDAVTPVMLAFSNLITPVSIIVIWLVFLAFAPGKRPGLCLFANMTGALILDQILKFIIQRPRPDGFRLATETGYSFPSAHAVVSMVLFGLIIWYVWHFEKSRMRRNLVCAAFGMVALIIGVSRVYLGVHYASDVLGGFALAILWLALFSKFFTSPFIGNEAAKKPSSGKAA